MRWSLKVGCAVSRNCKYELLATLTSDPEAVWEKAELLRIVWGFKSNPTTRTLDSHACRLRNKLRNAGGEYIHNVWGYGYRLLSNPAL